MNESDLLVVLGASFSNHTGIADYKPTIQVDADPMALGRFHPVTVGVQAHVGVCVAALADRLAATDQAGHQAGTRATDGSTSGPTWPSGGASGARRRPAGPPTTRPGG